jgi:hypothetical protein
LEEWSGGLFERGVIVNYGGSLRAGTTQEAPTMAPNQSEIPMHKDGGCFYDHCWN